MKQRLLFGLMITLAVLGLNGTIDLNALFNYEDQDIPLYVNRDNTPPNNTISDAGATLGRVLFYDVNLSANNTVACAHCHQQAFAFGDERVLSVGLSGGLTGRHSMRLVNARFSDEDRFFWDERAVSLEDQSTRPIQDHIEMGFSGEDGDPSLDSLIRKLSDISYYQELFTFAYGSPNITEPRMQRALAQFIRSIQSFDSKYDEGLALTNGNGNQAFPNFTPEENQGKNLFQTPPGAGGAGCAGCHRPPTFDIDPNTMNNGVIGVAGNPTATDLTNTRSPSLRDLLNPAGVPNGPFMHDGSLPNLMAVINHYDDIDFNPAINPTLDQRLRGGPGGQGQNLGLTQAEKNALVAFLATLSGNAIYTDERWSDPFSPDGGLEIIPYCGAPIETVVELTICDGDKVEGYSETGIYTDTFTASNGCDSIRQLELIVLPESHPDCVVNSTDDVLEDVVPLTYPNPFRDAFTLEYNGEQLSLIHLYDMRGRPLLQQQIGSLTQFTQVQAEHLPVGIYLLRGFTADGQQLFTKKMIKE
ncbi:MAG: cytochrome c peroxidase [Bacteroidota bacterium]